MKKGLFLIFAITVCIITGCNHSGYCLKGYIADSSVIDHNIFLCDVFTEKNIDTAVINGDGTFEFTGSVTEPTLARLSIEYNSEIGALFVLENGQISLKIDREADNETYSTTLSGTRLNEVLSTMDKKGHSLQDTIVARINKLSNDITLSPNELEERRNLLIKDYLDEFNTLCSDTYKQNNDNVVGLYTLLNWLSAIPNINLDSLASSGGEIIKSNPYIIQQIEAQKRIESTSVGKKFVDLIGRNLLGKESRLSDFVGNGKIAIIDFWASWCGPCRAEIPNLKRIKAEYGDRITIVGLNVHDTFDECVKAVKDEGISWPQIIDENGSFTEEYGIDGIPQIILVDIDGTILARDLRGNNIYLSVKNILDK